MALEIDKKIGLQTVIVLGAIVLSSIVGAVRILDTQKAMQEAAIRSDKMNMEAHSAIGQRITTVERFQARQEGFNAALAKVAAERGDG